MATRRSFRYWQLAFATLVFSIIHHFGDVRAVTLAWNANPESNIAGYKLFYGETNTAAVARNVGKVTQTQVTNLAAGKTYYFYLTALNTAGLESDPSTTVIYTQPAQAQPPAAPLNLAGAADSPNQIRVQWIDNSTTETGFRLLRRTGSSGAYTTNTLGANTTSFTDSGLTAATQYSYKVQAFNAAGSSAFSTEISITTPNNPPPLSGGARFLSKDWNTGGSWKANYGRDGYVVVTDSQLNPPYSSVSTAGQNEWIWNWNTDDFAALERGGSATRLAACWYTPDSLQVNIPLSGAGPYRFSVYCLDWDLLNRAQRFDILDAANNQILDSQSISNFSDGVFMTWEITKPVILKMTRLGGPNAVLSGIFFDTGSVVAAPVFSPASGSFSNSVVVSMSTTTTGATIRYTLDGSMPTSRSLKYVSPLTLTNTTTVAARAFKTGLADSIATVVTYSRTDLGVGRVQFVGSDNTRGGTWKASLGADGQMVAYENPGLPSYASVSISGGETWVWEFPTTDPAALERPYQPGRIATTWYGQTFTANVVLRDSNPHRVSFYFVDYDNNGRAQTIEIIDPSTSAVLDSVDLSSFGNGVWLTYEITGSFNVRVTRSAGANAVMSGIFFDQP